MMRFVVLLLCIQLGHGYPSGAPASTCDSMMPEHDVASQQCQANYLLQTEKTEFNNNDAIRITLRGATNNDHFKGFLLTAKTDQDQRIVGTWSITNSTMKTVSCNGIENTGLSHSSPDDKTQVEALWHAPASISAENTIIRATVVKSFGEIYVNCFRLTLKAKQVNPLSNQSMVPSGAIAATSKAHTNVTWSYANNAVTVTMITREANMSEWRSIGFSLDEEIGDEYIFVCQVSSTGNVILRRMHTKPGQRRPLPTNQTVTVIRTAYENGYATCQFSFPTNAAQADGEPAPIGIDKNYHIVFAAGLLETGDQLGNQNQTQVTSKTYQLQNAATVDFDASEAMAISSISSNITKTPVTTTSHSPTRKDAGADITWTYANGITDVKMVINNLAASQWLALGLSTDQLMGEDHVFACQHLADNTVSLRRLVNPSGYSRPVPVNTGVDFNITQQKLENGQVTCAFTLSNFAEAKRKSRQTNVPALSQTTMYHPLIAMGNLDGSNTLMKHSSGGRQALSQQVSLKRQETINYKSSRDTSSLVKAHGLLMIFAWMILASTGILVARYFKPAWPTSKICGKPVWFAIHRSVMITVVLSTLAAFAIILVFKKGQWSSRMTQRQFAHSIVGILVVIFATAQPFMAIFRCHPGAPYRFVFNYAHATVGTCAFVLSIAAIFLAIFFPHFDFLLAKDWGILLAWSCWVPVIFIIFEIIELCHRKSVSEEDEADSYNMAGYNPYLDPAMPPKPKEAKVAHNPRLDRVKGFLLLFHILVALALAITLMVLIGTS